MHKPHSGLSGKGLVLLTFFLLGGCTIGVQPQPSGGSNSATTKESKGPAGGWQQEITAVSDRVKKSNEIQSRALADAERRISLLENEINELRGSLEVARQESQEALNRLSGMDQQTMNSNMVMKAAPQAPVQQYAQPAPQPPVQQYVQTAPPSPRYPSPVVETPPPVMEPEEATIEPEPVQQAVQQTPPASSQEAYEAAFLKLRSGKYRESLMEFNQFLQWYPKDELADNAQYWIGELYYVQKQYPEALQAFNQVLVKWPASSKVPASLLKIGFAFYELGDMENARASLGRLVADYPTSNAVALANQRLKKIAERVGGQ